VPFRQLFDVLARFARGVFSLRGCGLPQFTDGLLHLVASLEEVPPGFLPRFPLEDHLALTQARFTLRQTMGHLARTLARLHGFASSFVSSASRASSDASSAFTSRSTCGTRASAFSSTSSGSPSRRAMLSPYERPGMPLMSRYVGAR
jgi:hypothetical protein